MIKNTKIETTYTCESCGVEYTDKECITNCDFCGKEICAECEEYVSYFLSADIMYGFAAQYEDNYICKSCFDKLKNAGIKEQSIDVKEIINKANEELRQRIMDTIK